MSRFAPLLFALVLLGWTARAEAARRALVVGQNVGLGPEAPLRFAEDDAAAVAATLEEVGAVAHGDITLMTGAHVSAVRSAVRKIGARSGPDDELFVFFSGHGGPDGAHLDGEVWPWTEVRADLEAMRARLVVAFFDACYSGAILTPKGLTRQSPIVVSVVPLGGRGRYLVTSSGANELSYESELIQGSPFAAALRSGLRGAADSSGDGRVTLPELYRYVYGRTLSATVTAPTGPQHPIESVQIESAGDVVLVERRKTGVGEILGADGRGRCYVLDSDGAGVLAELDRLGEHVLVAPATYVVKCVQADRVLVARATVGAQPVSLDTLTYSREALSSQLAKGSGEATVSRGSIALGVLASDQAPTAGAALLGYEGGTEELFFSGLGGCAWTGQALLAGGIGMNVPWWRIGGGRLGLGLEVGATLAEKPTVLSLGGGSFVEVDGPRLSGAARLFARLDLLATHPVDRGNLGATLVGSAGVSLGK
jgi:hypothetical protein